MIPIATPDRLDMQTVPQSPPGQLADLHFKALTQSRGDRLGAAAIAASSNWIHGAELERAFTKSAVADETTSTDAPLTGFAVQYSYLSTLRPASASEQISGQVRTVPSMTRIILFNGGVAAAEVGEGAPAPVSLGSVSSVYLRDRKFVAQEVQSDALVKLSAPGAQAAIGADLLASTAQVLDTGFIGVLAAAATVITSSGSTAVLIDADLRTAVEAMVTSKFRLGRAVWVMSASAAAYLAGLRTGAADALAYPNVAAGSPGILAGIPTVISANAGASLFLVNLDGLIFTPTQVELSVSGEANLQMDSAPDSPTVASTTLISLWQNNLVCLRARVWKAWFCRPAAAVQIGSLSF